MTEVYLPGLDYSTRMNTIDKEAHQPGQSHLKCAAELPAPLPEESGVTRAEVTKAPPYLVPKGIWGQ
jgi:hypothetical protein